MPLGIKQNNNLLYLTLDVWQDLVFLNEQAYPAGYFAANIMNQDQSTLQALIHYGGAISKEAEHSWTQIGTPLPVCSHRCARMSPPCWMCCGHTRPSASWTSLENWRCWINIAARTWWMP